MTWRPSYKSLLYTEQREADALRDEVKRLTIELAHVKALRCSFCDKTQHEVRKLIAGPARVHLR